MSVPDKQTMLDNAKIALNNIITGEVSSAGEEGRSFSNLSVEQLQALIDKWERELGSDNRQVFHPFGRSAY
jgi:hypothetical protein